MNMSDGIFPDNAIFLNDRNIMIAETDSTCDSTCHSKGMINMKKATKRDTVTAAIGEEMIPTEIGNMQVTQVNKNGREVQELELKDVMLNPQGTYSLFSMKKRMKEGWTLYGDETKSGLRKGSRNVEFDIIIKTSKGALFCAYFKRKEVTGEKGLILESKRNKVEESTRSVTKKISVTLAHEVLGHMGEARTRATAKHMGLELTHGSLKPRESCATGKAKQKKMPQKSPHITATGSNERIFLDILTIKKPKGDERNKTTKKNWRIIVDEFSGMKFSDFYETKNRIIKPTCERL